MRRVAVIMAGGAGERFWPASRRARPKQLLRLTHDKLSMLDEAIERITPLIPPEDVLIATSELLAQPIARAVSASSGLPGRNVLAEPEKRNTAACLALAAAELTRRHGDPSEVSMAVLTGDHLIGEPDRFRATVEAALAFAEQNDALVTIGVTPTRPETGYGYIEVDAPADERAGVSPPAGEIRPVARFREKPDLATAEQYTRSGKHLWNSGMFFWRVSSFLDGLARHMPELAAAVPIMQEALGNSGKSVPPGPGGRRASAARDQLRAAFFPLSDVSIDFGLMERASNVFVIRAAFPWDDVGAWDALRRCRPVDGAGNVATGDPVIIDSRDCVIHNDSGAEQMAVAVIGLEGVIVATTPDGVLVCAKDRAQDVRRAVAELRARGGERFT